MGEKNDESWKMKPLPREGKGQRLTNASVMAVFIAWLRSARNHAQAAQIVGLKERSVRHLANHGRPSAGIPPFAEMADVIGSTELLAIDAKDWDLKTYKWSRRKAVAQTLQICEGLRRQVRDAVLNGQLQIKTPEDAAKCARAVRDLESSLETMALSLDLVEGEAPPPARAVDKNEKQEQDVKELSDEELRRLAGADVVPMKEAG